eukprot:TRINITY_DN36026_c0_g1_i1.p2 TRINITY_DN36026_c0_g1~~TRINITY_DN36026_c0_g1_i1.p2  ORF type:complete len:333 (-),score=39.00 TRINITY_DN36026_c0_g1_i1:62-973(-)
MMDGERGTGSFGANGCSTFHTRSLVLNSGQGAVPDDNNVALDRHGITLRTTNPNADFFTYCDEYGFFQGDVLCPRTDFDLRNTVLSDAYGSEWVPVGSSAVPGEEFEIKLVTWDSGDDIVDTNVYYDDFMPIAEARQGSTAFGYQFTSDLELEQIVPDILGIYPGGTTSITLSFTIKNNGPEEARDITINFTPPRGTAFNSVSGANLAVTTFPAAAPYENNSFYKARTDNVLHVGEVYGGSITFDVLSDAPNDIQFKLSVTCSSIEKLFKNNYQVQMIYINKQLFFFFYYSLSLLLLLMLLIF